ncbi:hypothetical protein ABB37_05476 [Leptomonas pyrrhocoris]|uniref:Uncharacterized protein n=1 Tax=Leptomonas pyrrhocoris TaxID=157538 RepID=A0A0M9G0G2_LEPPY|nr:hypothetical protein ABB37_05476 [Leptomonas pyrrhocoris]KPA79713.1 hypothetical protein ABB37_05476 [Leptomonas pyrrhocoris]|eukprot:XP_015658152.1 hypothetical protein ABB37_05476 [Leptomonas pyrrhocoris]
MSAQPFRLVQPLARLLHSTLLQCIDQVQCSFHPNEIDGLYTYAYMDHVAHTEVCDALAKRFAAVHQRGDIVLSSDGLLFPLRLARRGINAVQHFPNTNAALEAAKTEVEKAALRDLLRLSNDDLSSKDVMALWSFAITLSQWDMVEEVLRHFPLQQNISLQDDREYRDLVLWACQTTHTSVPGQGNAGAVSSAGREVHHAQRFLTDVLGVESVVTRCKEAAVVGAASASSSTARSGDVITEMRRFEDRDADALALIAVAATLRKRCGITAEFPVAEGEWARWFGTPSSSSSAFPAAAASTHAGAGKEGGWLSSGGSTSLRVAGGSSSLSVWARRLLFLYDAAVPAYVRASLAPGLVSDLQYHYRYCDVHVAALFFLTVLPLFCRNNPDVDLRAHMRYYHNQVVDEMFWTASPAMNASAASSVSSTTPGKRGMWTANALAGGEEEPAAAALASSSTATSFFVPVDTAMNVLIGEACLMDEGTPIVPAHVPAIEAMLCKVLAHLRTHMNGASRRMDGTSPASLPLPLWGVWNPAQSSHLAVVLSRLMKAASLPGGNAASLYPRLDSLVAEGLEMLRRLLDVRVLQERGTASMLTTLLTACHEVVEALGGAAYEAQLRALVLEHTMHGFSRDGLKAVAQTALQRSHGDSDVKQAQTLEFVRQLEAAQLLLPKRNWI